MSSSLCEPLRPTAFRLLKLSSNAGGRDGKKGKAIAADTAEGGVLVGDWTRTSQGPSNVQRLGWDPLPQWIWIDQICINQQDDAEKSVQIGMIGDIYREAEVVTIWAGEGDSLMQQSLANLTQFAFAIARCPPMRLMGFTVLAMFSQYLESRKEILFCPFLAKSIRVVCGRSVKDWGELSITHLQCLEELGYGILKPFGMFCSLRSSTGQPTISTQFQIV
ncbi:heterokaryon incompatibility protein-domain-containing protein [Triangularia setosa]|uniref:Heterokaryon incompatibility protein-domain-containing protein n=1 Tax=Triangularia setosa TaxID=2587417 RepID=A0AAN7A4P8_9PEZI|nr:heterokaryon incompatibility protein-domain-containing protein [Podospora setosa]